MQIVTIYCLVILGSILTCCGRSRYSLGLKNTSMALSSVSPCLPPIGRMTSSAAIGLMRASPPYYAVGLILRRFRLLRDFPRLILSNGFRLLLGGIFCSHYGLIGRQSRRLARHVSVQIGAHSPTNR